jgi:NAD(P)-dependent dehydrogenase (short-subunit alcohol dehydrogenase family)
MQANTSKQSDRVWFVTGASSGFGRAVSAAVLESGGRVVATARDPAALDALVAKSPARAVALRLDVTDAAAARAALDEGVAHFGRLDVVFNNAGYGHVGAVEELSDEELRRQLDVNLFGVINVTRAALPHMREQRSGHLVQMSSLNGVEGLAGGGYYAASKFGIEGFSESLAEEVAHLGIKVTIVEPGPFRTRFLSDRSARWSEPIPDYAQSVGKGREVLRQMDGKQPGDPKRAAQAILRAVDAANPPSRLVLGRMAIEHVRATLRAELEELESWAELGAGADFPAHSDGETAASEPRPQPKHEHDSAPAHGHEDLVRRAYLAFNQRKIAEGVALMDPKVDWPNLPEGGFVHGREQVRRHWGKQFDQVDPRIEVDDVTEKGAGRVEARVRQVVRDLDGKKLSDERLVHVFTIANDLIARMEVRPSVRA